MFAASNAIIRATKLEATAAIEDHSPGQGAKTVEAMDVDAQLQAAPCQQMISFPGATIRDVSNISGTIIFSDAAWSSGYNGQPMPAGIGIYIQICGDRPCSRVSVPAMSPPTSSSIEAEAFGLLLAVKLADILHI